MPVSSNDGPVALTASYKSPSESKELRHAISSAAHHDSQQIDPQTKTTYLHELRTSSKQLQDEINDFLTQKMDEDKKAGLDSAKSQTKTKTKTKEELEEENYGEDAGEDDTG